MKKLALFFLIITLPSFLIGQVVYRNGIYSNTIELNLNQAQPLSFGLPTVQASTFQKIKKAKLIFKFYSKSNLAFDEKILFNLPVSIGYSFDNESQSPMALKIDNNHPQCVSIVDIPLSLPNGINLNVISPPPTDIQTKPNGWDEFINKLIVEVSYEIEVEVNPNMLPPIVPLTVDIKGKKARFKWNSTPYKFPSYEFQLLRLYNNNPTITDEWQSIGIENLDWSKALDIWTESSSDSLKLTVAEGTGFYVWRVRPIGNYFDGAITNPLNYGRWNSVSLINTLNRSNLSIPYFFFEDPDTSKNWIYSRTFSEDNKLNESIIYADELLNIKQQQTYLPSKDTILVSQKIDDFSGRSAFSTIPVPVPNTEGLVYKSKFVTSNSQPSTMYNARNFDAETNIYNPDQVSQDSAFQYYSDKNIDNSIPDAQGYPYVRTVYYNEPDPRVKEQSGIGKTHMISNGQANGMGRTVRTQYGIPTEGELVRIFGDEAPRPSGIIKTITTDQNNISQIQYTNMNGKVIATAISIADTTNTSLTSLNHDNSNAFNVTDIITENHKEDSGIISSKRFVIQRKTNFHLSYQFNCKVLMDKCTDYRIDCAFDLYVSLVNIDDSSFKKVFIVKDLTGLCAANSQLNVVDTNFFGIPPGTYIITKELVKGSKATSSASLAADRVANQIKPLTGLIKGWIDSVVCEKQLDEFYQKLDTLESDVKNLTANVFRSKYGLPISFVKDKNHKVQVVKDLVSHKPINVIVKSSCCTIDVSVVFIPPFKCPNDLTIVDKNRNEKIDVNMGYFERPDTSEFPVDFEGFAFAYLKSKACFGGNNNAIKTFLYSPINIPFFKIKSGLLQGYSPGDFNWMVYHMLADKYDCNGNLYKENPSRTSSQTTNTGNANDCENQGGIGGNEYYCDATNKNCTQYTCADLFTCWKGLLDQVVETYCKKYTEDETHNVSNEVDDYQGETKGKGKTHDNHFDENKKTSFIEGIAWWILNVPKKIRDAQKKQSTQGSQENRDDLVPRRHLAKQFLECTGYRFAQIITQVDPLPDSETVSSTPLMRKYKPDSWSGGPPTIGDKNKKMLFPNIKDPVYAFKYFYYKKDTFPVLEFTNCFEDPNICGYDASGKPIFCCPDEPDHLCTFCGYGKIKCESTYKTWSCGQRFSFYQAIENYENPDELEEKPAKITCSDYLEVESNGKTRIENTLDALTNEGIKACETRRSDFRRILRDTLTKKCYVIGECRSNNPTDDFIIPDKDFEAMVEAIIEQCKKQSEVTTYKCDVDQQCRYIKADKNIIGYPDNKPKIAQKYTTIRLGVGGKDSDMCTSISGSNRVYSCAATNLSYCDLQEHKQARTWQLEIDLPSKCNGHIGQQNFTCINNSIHTCVARNKFQNPSTSVYSPYSKPEQSNEIISPAVPIKVEIKNK